MKKFEGNVIGGKIRIGIVAARFNEFIVSKLVSGAIDGLSRHGVEDENIDVAWVPGAFEIPLIAKKMAKNMNRETMSAQAVGGAVGHNPISIIIPCHRVVGTTGSLTGYAGGIDKKIWLLKHEGVDMEGLFMPKMGTAL